MQNLIKTSILISIISVLLACSVQQPIPESQRFVAVVKEVPEMNKDQLYKGIRLWVAENFVSAKTVIDYDDREQGIIIVKGRIPYPVSGFDHSGNDLAFVLKVETKDGKFRAHFSNLIEYFNDTGNPFSIVDGAPVRVATAEHLAEVTPGLEAFSERILGGITKERDSSW